MKYIIALLTCCIGLGSCLSANLYNLDDPTIQTTLKSINSTYLINTDVHVLETGDTCADRTDYSACVRQTADSAVDLLFVINVARREMETSINTSLQEIMVKSDTLALEQSAIQGLQQGDTSLAINQYLQGLTHFLDQECSTYGASDCTGESLAIAKTAYLDTQSEDRARQTVKYLWTAVALLALGLLLLAAWKRITRTQRDSKNKKLLNQLINHTNFLGMTVKHDILLHEKDKKDLENDLALFEETLESLSSSTPDRLHMKLKEEKHQESLENLTQRYQEMLKLLGDSENILSQMEKIKQINI